MIKLCMNCATESPVDAVFCSECGMSLTRAPAGDAADSARSIADVQDTTERPAKRMRYLRWGLRLAAMACWTVLVGTGGYCLGKLLVYISEGRLIGVPKLGDSYMDQGEAILKATPALAFAPWVIGGIVLGVRWWKSRTPALPEGTE